MTKPDMRTPDFTNENIAQIAALFPNCVTEAKDEKGRVKKAIDFDLLKQELSANIVDGTKERYTLNWPGKKEALAKANEPINKTLRPCEEESVNFDTTQNLYIEGDNLEALKLLQESYLGKIKMIYIDPPYNTGKDFVYKDNFTGDKDDELEASGQKDEEGGRLVANLESNGRYHSDWLTMMYPRLKLARNLLKDDGVIFISIDDNEVHNLRKLCDEVFGEDNFIANIIWEKKYTRANDAKWFSDNHDHILCYGKNKENVKLNQLPRNEEQLTAYKNPDNHEKGKWKATPLHAKSGTNRDSYTFSNGITWTPPAGTFRRFNNESMDRMDKNNEIWFGVNGEQIPQRKSFLSEIKDGVTPITLWKYEEVGHNHEANNDIKELELGGIFSNPKPVRLLLQTLLLSTKNNRNDLILDFFSGSATTAHAVMKLNSQDNGNRRFIMVQLPEPTENKDFPTICEIGKERIRRAGKKILEENKDKEGIENLDIGFRVLKVDSSNMKDVYYNPDEINQLNLFDTVDNIKDGRSAEDLLFQVLLDWGVDLMLPIRSKELAGHKVFFVDDDALAACFEENLDEEFITELAKKQILRVVFKDSGFANDDIRINVEQIFKQYSPDTEVKVI